MSWGDWREVPGGGLTNLSLTGAADAGGFDLALFCVGLDGYININSYNFKSWSGWSKIPGTGRTMLAVSATSVGKILHLYGTGLDEVVYHRTFDGTTWSDWLPVPGGGKTRVAVCGVGDNLFATGLDNHVYFKPSLSIGWSEVLPSFDTTVAVSATLVAGILYLYAVRTDERIFWNVLDAGKVWGVWSEVLGSGKTQVAVSATRENVFATGLNHDLYLNPSPSSSVWSPLPVEFKTDAAPVAVTYISSTGAETLFLFVKGLSPNQKIYYNVRT
jgi:serine protease AprX